MKYVVTVLVLGLAVLAWDCDNSFSPKQDFKRSVVVFAVLSNTQSEQIVRLESTYDAELTNPDKPVGQTEITQAKVSMNAIIGTASKSFDFHDTLMQDSDGSRKHVWVSRDLQPVEAATYALHVEVPGYDPISAEVKIPSRSYVQLLPPNSNLNRYGIILGAGAISTQAPPKGFYFRLWIVGKKLVDGKEIDVRKEVPWRVDPLTRDTAYTKPGRETSVEFLLDDIAVTKADLVNRENAYKIEVVGTSYALDTYMYNYFQVVRGFDDPISVRQDRPDVTNIRNGVGILGAMTVDSVRVSYVSLITGK